MNHFPAITESRKVKQTEHVLTHAVDTEPKAKPDEKVPTHIFDAQSEFTQIKNARLQAHNLSGIEQKAFREGLKQRINMFRENLTLQKETTAILFETLYDMVWQNPSIESSELTQTARNFAQTARLPTEHVETLISGIQKYVDEHKTVLSYRELYPSDDELFEALFGSQPAGKIEVGIMPMNIMIQVYNRLDMETIYSTIARIRNSQLTKQTPIEDTQAEVHDWLSNANAFVLKYSNISTLSNHVVIENMGENTIHEQVTSARTSTEPNELLNLSASKTTIELETQERQNILISIETDDNQTKSVKVFETNNGSQVIATITKTSNGWFVYRPKQNLFETVKSPTISVNEITITIDPETSAVRIDNPNHQLLRINETTDTPTAKDANISHVIALHESQHLFNMLFSPEEPERENEIIAELDKEVRDELLAQLAEQRAITDIRTDLISNYLPYFREILSNDLSTGNQNITDEQFFRYTKHVESVTKAIQQLEQKTKSRQKTLSYLYPEPLSNWEMVGKYVK